METHRQLSERKAQDTTALLLDVQTKARSAEATQREAEKALALVRSEAEEKIGQAQAAHDKQLRTLMETHEKQLRSLKESAPQKIAYRSLASGDLALFFPTTTGFFVAFTDGSESWLRHHYLSASAMEALDVKARKPEWLVLELITIDRKQATTEYNPYKLPIGTRFAELHGARVS